MNIAYIECASGVSGDMLVGALVNLGVPIEYLRQSLSFLPVESRSISCEVVVRCGVRAAKFNVFLDDNYHRANKWSDVERIISDSTLNDGIKQRGLKIFKGLFIAEARVHGTSYDQTHLHELGAIDCLVDILGCLLAIDYLRIERLLVSPINVGGGVVKTQHGTLPVPAPATAELLKGLPIYSTNSNAELTTPTGAAIIKEECTPIDHFPMMTLEAIGCGAGQRESHNHPNILRIFKGKALNAIESKIIVIETNIDDMSPQLYEPLMERLLKAGALDVFLTPIIMKKGRPAVKLSIITPKEIRQTLTEIIFNETTTIGLRFYEVDRETLERKTTKISTSYGDVQVKLAIHNGRVTNAAPEFEDCRLLAERHNVAIKAVYSETSRLINDLKDTQIP